MDADLVQRGYLRPDELHPLVAAALGHDVDPSRPIGPRPLLADAIEVRCGDDRHRVEKRDGVWHALDHLDDDPSRESLLARLGGRVNPCRQAVQDLSAGLHVLDVVAHLLEHGRADEVLRVLDEHAGTSGASRDTVLPDGATVRETLSTLRYNTLRLRLALAGLPPVPGTSFQRTPNPPYLTDRRRPRKGAPARTPR
jgi:hypothetical protein